MGDVGHRLRADGREDVGLHRRCPLRQVLGVRELLLAELEHRLEGLLEADTPGALRFPFGYQVATGARGAANIAGLVAGSVEGHERVTRPDRGSSVCR